MSETAAVEPGVSAGALLREAREAAGLHVATLAANLKVPVRKLEALEEDRYDLLPDAVFVRALASSVCRSLKLDPQPVLERLPQTASPRLVQDGEGLNAPFRAPSDGPGPSWLDQLSRPVVLTVGALLLGALVLVFLPAAQRGLETVLQANRQPEAVMPPAGTGTPAVVTTAPAEPPLPPTTTAASPAAPATPAAATAVAAVPATAQPIPAAAPVTGAANLVTAPTPAAAGPVSGIVVFRTRAPSWIQVVDAGGTTVLQRLMEPGESAGASGQLPLSVVIGAVDATEVQVRGKPYNLAPVSRDNVARFEVK